MTASALGREAQRRDVLESDVQGRMPTPRLSNCRQVYASMAMTTMIKNSELTGSTSCIPHPAIAEQTDHVQNRVEQGNLLPEGREHVEGVKNASQIGQGSQYKGRDDRDIVKAFPHRCR